MQKFSKIRPIDEYKDDKNEILYSDSRIKIIKYEDWHVIKGQDAVCCIPYLIESNEMILRNEYIPTFKYVDGQEYHITLVCGGIEAGETPEKAMIRELKEEAGIVLREDYDMEKPKSFFAVKSVTTKYYIYIIPLSERDYEEVLATGDGSKVEEMSKSVKVNVKYIDSINTSDMVTAYTLLLLKEYLNLLQ